MVVLSEFWSGESRRKYQEGDMASPRGAICQLPDLSSMQVKVKVGEADAPKVRIGLPVRIHLEALPTNTFVGTVKEIASLATESDPWSGDTPGRRSFEVSISMKAADPSKIKPGMTAEVEFICDSIADAVYVPIESVIERSGKTFVYVKNSKGFEKNTVTLGKSNDNYVVVAKGLDKGEVIALRDPTKPIDEQDINAGKAEEKEQQKKPAPVPVPGAG